MATQKPTQLGYAEIAKRMATAGDGAGSCVKSVVGIETACTAAEASTFASPGGGGKIASNGLDLADADTVATSTTSVTDDTVDLDHEFTFSGTQQVKGFAIENDDDTVIFAEACFAADVNGINGDTLDVQMKMQFKLGA